MCISYVLTVISSFIITTTITIIIIIILVTITITTIF